MPWVSLLHNPEGIASVYEGSPPDLLGVRLHEVVLHRDRPTLRLRLDLPRFPDRPPHKWAAQEFDTLQVEISLSGVREVEVAGFGTAVTADVRLGADNGVILDVTSPETRVRAVAAAVFVSKLSAYRNGA
ncbi:Imm50 family immunity protein [Streptomyces sp. NPDC015684]|uniref:Imm50 family immunity protein n=1 Tax=Streptomyces sp. NPDC015684 TaxID=3364963 RepID=UPI003701DBAF